MALTKVNSILVDGAINTDSSGNVGIGTSSPGVRLQIGNPSDSNQALRFDFSNSSTARINSTRVGAGNLQSLLLAGQDTMQFQTAGTERMRIDSSGRVTMPYQPAFRVSKSGNQSISAGTPTTVQINNVNFDIGSNLNTSTYRFTAPVSGRYLFTAAIQFTSTVGQPHATIALNGSGQEPWLDWGGSGSSAAFQARTMNLSAGDYVELLAFTTTSATLDGPRCVLTGFLVG